MCWMVFIEKLFHHRDTGPQRTQKMSFLLCVSVVKKLSAHEKCTRRPTTNDQRQSFNSPSVPSSPPISESRAAARQLPPVEIPPRQPGSPEDSAPEGSRILRTGPGSTRLMGFSSHLR